MAKFADNSILEDFVDTLDYYQREYDLTNEQIVLMLHKLMKRYFNDVDETPLYMERYDD